MDGVPTRTTYERIDTHGICQKSEGVRFSSPSHHQQKIIQNESFDLTVNNNNNNNNTIIVIIPDSIVSTKI